MDALGDLKMQLDQYVIGYFETSSETVKGDLQGRVPESERTPLRFSDYNGLALPEERLDDVAKGRLGSLSFWLTLLEDEPESLL